MRTTFADSGIGSGCRPASMASRHSCSGSSIRIDRLFRGFLERVPGEQVPEDVPRLQDQVAAVGAVEAPGRIRVKSLISTSLDAIVIAVLQFNRRAGDPRLLPCCRIAE